MINKTQSLSSVSAFLSFAYEPFSLSKHSKEDKQKGVHPTKQASIIPEKGCKIIIMIIIGSIHLKFLV